ncbi:MAG TPA: hypothetical protein VF365_01515 [Candidatus Limnocylindria bacterium]
MASATPAADANSVRFAWSEVPFDGSVSAVTGDGSRFVAVGTGTDGVSSWTSSDGITWEEDDVPERSFGQIGDGSGRELMASMGQLVRLGDTLYSFGGMHFMDSETGVGWRWTDGSDWELIESDSGFFDGGVAQVTASDDALFGVNSGFTGGPRLSPSTWLWTPATSWVQTPLTTSADAEIAVYASAWGNGTFVAAGSSARRVEGVQPWDWPQTPSMWTSPDGRIWTAIQPPAGMSSVCSLTARPSGGFVALGRVGERAAAWTSLSGDVWLEGTIAPPDGVGAGQVFATPCNVVPVGEAMLAIAPVEGGTTPIWTSIDGRSWAFGERLDVVGVHATKMAALGDHALLFGNRVDPEAEGGFRSVLLRARTSPGG